MTTKSSKNEVKTPPKMGRCGACGHFARRHEGGEPACVIPGCPCRGWVPLLLKLSA